MNDVFIFFREEGWYSIKMPQEMLQKHGEEKCISDNAKCNPGTLRVEDLFGRVVWKMQEAQ